MNNPSKYTPAPWCRDGDTLVGVSRGDNDKWYKHNICELLSPVDGDDTLIQFAPDLFVALRIALPYIEHLKNHPGKPIESPDVLRDLLQHMLDTKQKVEGKWNKNDQTISFSTNR